MAGAASIEPRLAPDLRDKASGAPEPPSPPDDGGPGGDRPEALRPDCPVKPLGRLGSRSYYLDAMGQLVCLGTKDWNDVMILTLFGRDADYLETEGKGWPRYGKPVVNEFGEKEWPIVGFDYAKVKKALVTAAANMGIFDPQGMVRGPGAHRGEDGELILHCGDKIMVGGLVRINGEPIEETWHPPGKIDGFVYPTASALHRPSVDQADDSAGRQLLRVLKTWSWRRPMLDPVLMLGQIAALPVAGALEWRPHSWVTGGAGTGKSTLLGKRGLLPIMFDKSLIVTADATEAGLRQITSQKTLPILFEELEPDWANPKSKAVIELARKASSGADIYRGGSDHQAASFKAETSFVFSSILIPPMLTQDRGRLAILELDPLPKGASGIRIDRAEWQAIGRQLRRRVADQWFRFEHTLDLYRLALAAAGHDARGQDQFGTLLACHDLVLYDGLEGDEDRFDHWARQLDTNTLAEAAGRKSDDIEVLEHLRTSFLHSRGGDDRETISQVVLHAIDDRIDHAPRRARARERLQAVGLRVGTVTDKGGFRDDMMGEDVYLAVAGPGNVGLKQLFDKTRWYDGGWTQSMARVPGARSRIKVRFAGAGDWSICVPIAMAVQLVDEESEA